MMQPDGPERIQRELDGPSPFHMFPSMMVASESMLASDYGGDTRTDGNAAVSVYIPLFFFRLI